MDVSDLSDRLLLAIPKKGRLHDACLQILKGADVQFHRRNRLDIALSTNMPVALVFLPAHDIPSFVGRGRIALGITGVDMVCEAAVDVDRLVNLGFGRCRLAIQVPVSSGFTSAKDLVGKRIATSFTSVVTAFFAALERGVSEEEAISQLKSNTLPMDVKESAMKTSVSYVSGSVEAACALGLADAVVDLVESGETMREAKLHDISSIISSEAVLIANRETTKGNPLVDIIRRRIEGVIAADRYVLCGYNIPRAKLRDAVQITPGKKAPTVSPLEDSDWVAISSMVLRNQIASKMDELTAVGAVDIIVTKIDNCRVDV